MQQQVHLPDLVGVEIYLRVVLDLSAQVLALCQVANFRKPSADRLHTDLNLHILRDRAARRRIQNHEKGSDADIGMRPESYDTRAYPLAFDNRKRRAVMRVRRPS